MVHKLQVNSDGDRVRRRNERDEFHTIMSPCEAIKLSTCPNFRHGHSSSNMLEKSFKNKFRDTAVCSRALQRRMSKSHSGERPFDNHHRSTVLMAYNLLT